MPLVDFEAFILVLLELCSNNSDTRSQPSINRGHKNKRTKHNLHSGEIQHSAAMCMRLHVYVRPRACIRARALMHLCYCQLCSEAPALLVPSD